MRYLLPILAVLLLVFGPCVAVYAGDVEPAGCCLKGRCPTPQPEAPAPPPFEFPDDEVDEVDVGDGEDSVLATIVTAAAAIAGAASGYFVTREDPEEPEVAADEVVPEAPDPVV